MKALLPVCAGIAVISSITSVTLWHELRAERLTSGELRTQLVASRTAVQFPAAPAPPGTTAPATAAAVATTGAEPNSAPAAPPKPAPQSTAAMIENSLNLEKDLMKNPEYRRLRLAQARSSIKRNYPGLIEELGLSEKDADSLFDLLAEQQTALSAEMQFIGTNGTQDQAAMQDLMRRQQAMQREQDEAVRNLLGSKYTQWQDYQQTLPARSRVTNMSSQLAQAGIPLTEAQTRSLTATMIVEQQRQRQEQLSMARALPNPTDPDSRARMMEESLKRTEENNRRIVDVAAPHLSPRQAAAVREQLEQQTAMLRISMQMAAERERLQPQGQAPGQTQRMIVVPAISSTDGVNVVRLPTSP
jgi:hypothetical protein